MAQPRPDHASASVADSSGLLSDIERPLFFRNEVIDSIDNDLPHLAAESIGVATESEPELATGVAYRDSRQADALHEALEGAHLRNYHLVQEVEAVIEYLAATGEARNANTVALFDLGSSGLTVSVVDLVRRQVIASQRTGEYSGDLFDDQVRNNQLERLGKPTTDPDIELFEKRCRVAKERLSTQDAVCLPDASGMILLSRDNFELLIGDLVDEAIEFARGVMIGAHTPIDAVVLIGGGARMPILQNRVGPSLELPSIVPTEPETVAARGAALSARPHVRSRSSASSPVRPSIKRIGTAHPIPVHAPVVGEDGGFGSSKFADGATVATDPVPVAEAEPVAEPAAVEPAAVEPAVASVPVAAAPVAAAPVVTKPVLTKPAVAEPVVAASAVVAAPVAAAPVVANPVVADRVSESAEDDGKPVPFQLKNVYWLDADYDDDDGEDDRTKARRKMRTGGVLALGLAVVVGLTGFLLTNQNTPQVVDTSVSRTQANQPATTTPASTEPSPTPVVLPPPPPPTTVEPTVEQETEVYQEPTTTTTTPPTVAPPTVIVPSPAPAPAPPPLIPGFPEFTLPVFPPLLPPAP